MIYFVGAGPGDPELITLKGYRLISEADLIIYTGSLINQKILEYCKDDVRCIDSASLNLQEITDLLAAASSQGEKVVRLHTGDPSLYGAIGEQMDILEKKDIPYSIVPGVSSFLAAAASLKRQYTVPEGSQTLIITRLEGRTPVPESERLNNLAAHGASMAIFLSAGMIDKVVEELLKQYPPDTEAAVVEKASWPEEQIVQGQLQDLVKLTEDAGIKKTALILVGDFLRVTGKSRLYDKDFRHEYRS
ncbi:cobalt-precorrin-4 c11-methyltransferase [hydrocarbon metagenome]|uniref:Cobalt-precorrin-4 c11-methyltransferase n=1 Tax=hydrocarbon metagenome TaxID=938273 RepID=A0A0W8EA18_9ZZZZ